MTTTRPDQRFDVVVVGARCAGAATGLLLARQGFDVLIVDRATFPSDTLSTHAIARGGIVQLARWGLLDAVVGGGAPPVRTARMSFQNGDERLLPIKEHAGVDLLLAPRRHVLDTTLISAAVADGATFRSGFNITGVTTDESGRVTGVTGRDSDGVPLQIASRWVIGADGVNSRIARSVGARVTHERPADSSATYTYVRGLGASGFEFYVGDHGYAGVFPTHDDEAVVWICSPGRPTLTDAADRSEAFLRLIGGTAPSLAERVRDAGSTAPVRGPIRVPNRIREPAGPGWSLVGDAGYHHDPITGHGITDAFRDAELLAGALGRALRGERSETAAMDDYARERLRALMPILDVTCELAEFPSLAEFRRLLKQLNRLAETEAEELAALPDLRITAGEAA